MMKYISAASYKKSSFPIVHLLFFLAIFCFPPSHSFAAEYVWLEGENPTSANIKPNMAGWGHKELMSGQKWLDVNIADNDVEKNLPEAGGLISYDFHIKSPGSYQIWNRIGFEFARSDFDWRIDNGKWSRISSSQLTTDAVELDFWCEAAWIQMGTANLQAGNHKLIIRLPKEKDLKGKYLKVLYASDALCIYKGQFYPNLFYKPGENRHDPIDIQAEKQIFKLPAPATSDARSEVELNGAWQVCRFDEQIPGPVDTPIKQFPAHPYWTGMQVPGDKFDRPDFMFAHRLWYRTRVQVPTAAKGRSFHIIFPLDSLNTTVYVNGVYCGFERNPFCRFQVDVTKEIKPGVNEIWVGIRDAYYGYTYDPKDPMKLRKMFNLPLKYFGDGFQDLAYPVWNASRSGILNTPVLVCAGAVKSTDVFVKTSVKLKRLDAEVTLLNTTSRSVSGEILTAAINQKTGKTERTFPIAPFKLSPGAEKVFNTGGNWESPKLWWPDDPNMYTLRTTIKVNGKPDDVFDQSFGFREWGANGTEFTLNGINWPMWADLIGNEPTKEAWLQRYRETNQRSMRLMGAAQGGIRWMGMTTDTALDFFDKNGVVVRRCGPLDGEAIGYNALENDPNLKQLYHSDIKMDLMHNWISQMAAQVKGERNHPSIAIWSIENEWLYINCINLYGGYMDQFEQQAKKCSDAVRAVDPTRLNMTDGGGANKDQSMPVHGNHYVFGDQGYDKYPKLAYEPNVTGGGRGRWVWDQKRPRFIGEDYFAEGINPADYAIFGGESAFAGKTEARPAASLIYRFLAEGYRWAGQSAWQFWLGNDNVTGDPWVSNSPRAVFCREWDWSFGSGEKVNRTCAIYNDTEHPNPLTFVWTLQVGGKQVDQQSKVYSIPPGGSQRLDITLPMPEVSERTEGSLTLQLAADGQTVFTDKKDVSVLPVSKPASAPGMLVYDPSGEVKAYLQKAGVSFQPITSLASIPADGKLLIIGRNALTEQESASSALAAWAVNGRRVIVFEQKYPLKFQALPTELDPTTSSGEIAFAEDMGHPIMKGLEQKDFFDWQPDEIVYQNAYDKPGRGARSLVQCSDRLSKSAMLEVPVGTGLIIVSQLTLGEKLATSAVAQKLAANMIDYAESYTQQFRQVTVVNSDPQFQKALDAVGLSYSKASDPVAAISDPNFKLAVISASPQNLQLLADNLDKVNAFTENGGYIFLNGLTPEGLQSYNKLVGFNHMIRPFWREKVTFSNPRNPLTAGLTLGDIVMLSGERIFGWTSDEFVANDIFSYIVDLRDVAPFMQFPNDFAKLMVDGMRDADGWKYIVNLPLKDADWTLKLPAPQTLTQVTWYPNQNYNYVTKFMMDFDGRNPQSFDLKVNDDPQTFDIQPPQTTTSVHLKITDVQKNPGYNGDVTGLDNIRIIAQRPADFDQKVKPMLNIGGIVEYPRGKGGIVLCNLLFKDTETVPINAVKKRTILSTLLGNLDAPFVGGKTVIAGMELNYEPIDIGKQATQYRDEKGWFGDKQYTFKDLPVGRQNLNGVTYQIYDFPTSPVPTAIMLGGNGIPNNPPDAVTGIPVNRKADALFFLQTARIDQGMSADDWKNNRKYELFKYIIHYADGTTAEIHNYIDIDVADYHPQTPASIRGAQIAWSKPYIGTDRTAVAYTKQWNNPKPDVEIQSIDMVYGPDRRGVPVLLALTAANTR
jgi:hypothetical protein